MALEEGAKREDGMRGRGVSFRGYETLMCVKLY
jgi:hypothetical protein